MLPLPAETSREAPKCAWQHQEGGPETRSGTVQSLKCCPCQQKRAARLPSAAPGSIKTKAPKRARVPSRSAAPASRNEPRGCQVLHQGGGPETRSGTVQSLKCCPCQQKRAARLKSAAPGSIRGGGPETRSGTVQSLKCCPSLLAETSREAQKCCAWQHQGGGAPKRARAPCRA